MSGCTITSTGSLGAAPFEKTTTLILAFEANSALSQNHTLISRVLAYCVVEWCTHS